MYSSDLLTLLFLLLLSYRSQKVAVTEKPKEDETPSDNEELSENKERDESEEASDEEEDDVTETENGEDNTSNEACLKQFHEEQLKAGHMASQKEHCIEIGRVVRKTIFPEIKFANSEKFFDYQPVRDEKDGSIGMLFRRIRSKVATVGANEEQWWMDMKKPVKDALQKKRGTVCQAIKLALLGKLTCILVGRDKLEANTFCLPYNFYNEIKPSGRMIKLPCQG